MKAGSNKSPRLGRVRIERTVRGISRNWVEKSFALMDKVNVRSRTRRWKREDPYRV